MQTVTHVGHENRGLISMTDMQFDCVYQVVRIFFFESLTNNRTVSSLETVLLFVEFKTYQTKGAKKISHVGFELGTTSGPSRGLDHCTTVVKNVAVHKNKYSRKQKGHIVNTHLGGYSVG